MAWKKAPPELVEHMDRALAPLNCDRRIMFGFPAYFVNGNMFAGLFEDTVFLRLSEEDRRGVATAWEGATQFEPMPGRPMREYMVVPESLYRNEAAFGEWLERAYRYAVSLGPKRGKRSKA